MSVRSGRTTKEERPGTGQREREVSLTKLSQTGETKTKEKRVVRTWRD